MLPACCYPLKNVLKHACKYHKNMHAISKECQTCIHLLKTRPDVHVHAVIQNTRKSYVDMYVTNKYVKKAATRSTRKTKRSQCFVLGNSIRKLCSLVAIENKFYRFEIRFANLTYRWLQILLSVPVFKAPIWKRYHFPTSGFHS